MTTFALTIRLGNDLMQTGEDVADALAGIAGDLCDFDLVEHSSASIKDVNGNRVGEWFLVPGDAQVAHMTVEATLPPAEPPEMVVLDENDLHGSPARARPRNPGAATRSVLP